ncbi:MAG: hypothetical protein ABFS30_12835 [Pseudomonadota bacterium]
MLLPQSLLRAERADLETFEVVRYGCCYELTADVLAHRFGIRLPPVPPGHIGNLIGRRL